MSQPHAPPNPPMPILVPPWFVGAMIGMTIMTMATSAMSVGAGLALTGAVRKPRGSEAA